MGRVQLQQLSARSEAGGARSVAPTTTWGPAAAGGSARWPRCRSSPVLRAGARHGPPQRRGQPRRGHAKSTGSSSRWWWSSVTDNATAFLPTSTTVTTTDDAETSWIPSGTPGGVCEGLPICISASHRGSACACRPVHCCKHRRGYSGARAPRTSEVVIVGGRSQPARPHESCSCETSDVGSEVAPCRPRRRHQLLWVRRQSPAFLLP